jgi:hypothetical protein
MSVIMTLQEILNLPAESSTTAEKKDILLECLDADTLAHPSVAGMTHICRQIKDTMILIGLNPGENRRKRLPIRIAEGLGLEQAEISEIESAISNTPHQLDESSLTSMPTAAQSQPHESSAFSISKAISSRYTDHLRYNGQVDDEDAVTFKIFRATYTIAMQELGVPHGQQAALVHHALKGPALDYYHSNIYDRVTQLAEVFVLLERKFLSESVKLGIRTKLLSLRLADFQSQHDCGKLEAVEIAKRDIYRLSQQGQQEYRTDAAMIDIMEKSVLSGEAWSTEIATRRATQTFSFDEYCNALTSWIRATVEKSGTQNVHGDFGKPSGQSPGRQAVIMYGEQYNERRRRNQKGTAFASGPRLPAPSVHTKRGNCRRCGKPGHWQAQCRERERPGTSHLDALHARVKDAGGGSAGLAKVLYEVGEELDSFEEDQSAEDDDADHIPDAYEAFFLTDRETSKPDFHPTRA